MTQQRSPARYPTGGDYVDALQAPGLAFTDPQLRSGTVKADDLGMPEPVSGNFASVFHIYGTAGEQWAIKCFVRPDPDRHRRYDAIATALQTLHHPALVDFDYQVDGVMVAGQRYPLLKMRWVQAQGLMSWLESHLSFPDRILSVAAQFAEVVTVLERAGIAHGDLQHGNLLITANDELKLIDYDGMFVPQLVGLPANEKGLANYQHPRRADRDYGPGLDRFSAWVIYASLIALATRPDLWRRLRVSDDDTKLLFASADYLDPAASDAFQQIRTAGSTQLTELADHLMSFTGMLPAQLPPLESVTAGKATSATPAAHAAKATEVPDWLADHLDTTASPAPTSAPAGAFGQPVTYSFAGRNLILARIAAAFALLMTAGGAAAYLGWTTAAVVPLTGWFLAAAVAAAVIASTYLTHPLTAARRRAAADCVTARRAVVAAANEVRNVQHLVVELDASGVAQRQAIDQQRTAAVRQRDAATGHAQQVLQQTLQAVQQQRSNWHNSQQAREQKRLEAIAAEYVRQALAGAVIAKNPPSGIHAKLAGALAVHGFRTAADFVEYRTVSGHGQYPKTYIKRTRTDYGTYVENIGETRAQSLIQWREAVKTRAEAQAPRSLSAQQRREVAAELQQFHAGLDAQENAAKSQARGAIDHAKGVEQAAQAGLDKQQRDVEADLGVKRANLERRAVGAQNAVAAARRGAAQRDAALTPLKQVTLPRYLRASSGGSASWAA